MNHFLRSHSSSYAADIQTLPEQQIKKTQQLRSIQEDYQMSVMHFMHMNYVCSLHWYMCPPTTAFRSFVFVLTQNHRRKKINWTEKMVPAFEARNMHLTETPPLDWGYQQRWAGSWRYRKSIFSNSGKSTPSGSLLKLKYKIDKVHNVKYT